MLTRDGRRTLRAPAATVGMSEPAVRDRLADLERAGVITGYRVVVEPAAAGAGTAAFVALRFGPGAQVKAAVRGGAAQAARTPGRRGLSKAPTVVAVFTQEELAYLRSQPLARLATVGPDGQPDVVPVAYEFDGTHFWVGGPGESFLGTRKVRNVVAGGRQVAFVVDDLVSTDPFIARGIRVYGRAEPPVERVGLVGPGWYVRITPTVSWSWNMAGEPAGETWYPARRAVHGS